MATYWKVKFTVPKRTHHLSCLVWNSNEEMVVAADTIDGAIAEVRRLCPESTVFSVQYQCKA